MIKEDIENRLWWDPYVNAKDVEVRVEDGIAELNGTVNTWRERQAAAQNAFFGGARAVRNNLYVRYGPERYGPAPPAL
jgi:osmotically-inducible protein OsmY